MIVARGGKRGKTSGRGGKGQSARAGNKRRPEWRDIIKRLPKLRGRGKSSNKSFQKRPVVLNIISLEESFLANDSVTPTTLVEKGIISTYSGNIPAVKILGDGELSKALKISGCFVSASAKEKIEKVGGSVILPNADTLVEVKPSKKVEKTSVSSKKAAVVKDEKEEVADKKKITSKKKPAKS